MNVASEPASERVAIAFAFAWFDRGGGFGFAERARSIKIWGFGDVTSRDKFGSVFINGEKEVRPIDRSDRGALLSLASCKVENLKTNRSSEFEQVVGLRPQFAAT